MQTNQLAGKTKLVNHISGWKPACIVFVFCAAAVISSPAQTFTTLADFDFTDGAAAYGSLVQGLDGNFYGGTGNGGINPKSPCGGARCGVIFKIAPGGTLTVVHYLCSRAPCADGFSPSPLVLAANRDFYGTTTNGGEASSNCPGPLNCGAVFAITPSGTLLTLHAFDGTDGLAPSGALVQTSNGILYGTTGGGGANQAGTVFEITAGGTLTTLHSFDMTDGADPSAALVQASNGNFYGSTNLGGLYGNGTIFKITPGGTLTSLHSFTIHVQSVSTLVQGASGNFYGTTTSGDGNAQTCPPDGCGTVFEITPQGTLTTLHKFVLTDGEFPNGPLVLGTDGNFYGTTVYGGVPQNGRCSSGCGTIFQITPQGTLTTLHVFQWPEGETPEAGLVQGTDGNFYGTTASSGDINCTGCGTVFSLSMGLGPFVRTLPISGSVGRSVKILGTDLTGATSVTFNGTAATFTVVSATEITTTVPTGATTGAVKVVAPSGTLSSNVSFRVF